MDSKSLKNRKTEDVSNATSPGPKPWDFPLGTLESRAAARAMVDRMAARMAEPDVPRPGDILIDLDFLPPDRAAEVYRLLTTEDSRETPELAPGEPRTWLKPPKDVDPNTHHGSQRPLAIENASDEVLLDVIECIDQAFRVAKQNGQVFPPHLDPDLTWSGTGYTLRSAG